jgi:hypothetical protein
MNKFNIALLLCLIAFSSALKFKTSKALTKQGYFNRNTPANDDGGGNLHYLDRHAVYCNAGEIMQGFHLYRPTSNTIAYQYRCITHPSVGTQTQDLQTPVNTVNTGNMLDSTNYLDRHNVACPAGFALQGFRMLRSGTYDIYIAYRCVSANLSNCSTFELAEQWGNEIAGSPMLNIYLDRQWAQLFQADGAIQRFQLYCRYADRTYYRYSITWCTLVDPRVTVRGLVKNATNNQLVALTKNIRVAFRNGAGADVPATIIDGSIYQVTISPGTYTRIASADDYIVSSTSVVIQGPSDENRTENTALLSPVINGWRMVVQWTPAIKDIDSTLVLPDGSRIYYNKKVNATGNITLDQDSTDSSKPETISMVQPAAGIYKYYVQRYTKESTITNSGAKVTLFKGNTQMAEVLASSVQSGVMNVWQVFEIDTAANTFRIVNQFY